MQNLDLGSMNVVMNFMYFTFYGLSVVFDNKRLDVDRIFPSSVHIFSFYRRQTGTTDRLCFVVG